MSALPPVPEIAPTAPRKPVPTLLIPLPIISIPFERIGMDLVRLLPKSASGHEYIVMIVDYATTYPEAVPLQKVTSRNITKELMLLFNHVGIPKDILTNQSTTFKLMVDLYRLLQGKHLRTSLYHPQTDGLVECFNQTLKRMLKWAVDEELGPPPMVQPLHRMREPPGIHWLHSIRAAFWTVSSWTGRCGMGGMEGAALAIHSDIDFIQGMQEWIDQLAPIIIEHMEATL